MATQEQLNNLFPTIGHFTITTPSVSVVHLKINRPAKRNCFTSQTWHEFRQVITTLANETDTRVIILSGEGKHFCSGIDVSELSNFATSSSSSSSSFYDKLRDLEDFQDCITTPLKHHIPIIAVTHGICFGLALDIIAATQIRLTSEDSVFSIKEIDVGIIADIGSLQRLPHLTGNISKLTEYAYTGRNFNAREAKELGLVSDVFKTKDECLQYALNLAEEIKIKYWPALKGTKKHLDLMTNNNKFVKDGLSKVALDNSKLMNEQSYSKYIKEKFRGLKL